MKVLHWLAPALVWCCCASGCAGFQTELLESRLRQREDEAMLLRTQAKDLHFQLTASRRENGVLRSQMRDAGVRGMLPEQAAALFSLKEIRLSRLMTGGIDTDGFPGDDTLSLVLEPHDQQGDVLKAPGTITIELLDLSLAQVDRRIGYWTFDLETALKHWQGGLFGTGYHFKLPWQRGYPRHPNLSLHARLLTPDGRAFQVTKQITVRLAPGAALGQIGPRSPAASPLQPGASETYSVASPKAARKTPTTIPSPALGSALPVVVPEAGNP